MENLKELENHINLELDKYQVQRINIEKQIENLPISLKNNEQQQQSQQQQKNKLNTSQDFDSSNMVISNSNNNLNNQSISSSVNINNNNGNYENSKKENLQETLLSSKKSFDELSEHSLKIKKDVDHIQNISVSALKDFEKLKYRKINVEMLLNTISAFQELKNFIPDLEKAVKDNDIDKCIKSVETYNSIKQYLIEDFVTEYQNSRIQEEIEKTKILAKEKFESGLKQNNQDLISKCSQLQRLLNVEETQLEKILETYSENFKKQLQKFEEDMFTQIPSDYLCVPQFFEEGHYQYPFQEFFIKILTQLWNCFNEYKDTIYQYYNIEGLRQMFCFFIGSIASTVVKRLFKKMGKFYLLEKLQQQVFNIQSGNSQQSQLTKKEIDLINTYCNEVIQISSENENFNREINKAIKEMDEKEGSSFKQQLEQMEISNNVLELLGNYISFQEIYLKTQILQLLEKSGSYSSLLNFNKGVFQQFIEKEEQLVNLTGFWEFIDQIFFIIKHTAIQALETLNKSSACAVIQQISQNIIGDLFKNILIRLLDKYIKKEYFSSSSISLSSNFLVHNSFIIILFNNVEIATKFLKKLNNSLSQEILELYTEQDESSIRKAVKYCLDEMEMENEKLLQNMLKNKMKLFSEYLKITIKDLLDEFRGINFSMNEALLVQYEQSETFSKKFTVKMQHYLQQWKIQLTQENFEMFMQLFSEQIVLSLEQMVFQKRFHQLGGILLDKEIRQIITFFQNITEANIKPIFKKLSYISDILMLESYADVQEFQNLSQFDIPQQEINQIVRLRIDFNIPQQNKN